MKLNFWQWLGVVLLVVGGSLYIYRQMKTPPSPNPSPTSQPVPANRPAT